MIETSKCCLYNFERFRLLTNTDNHTWLNSKRRNVNYLAINNDVLVTNQLTSCSTSWSDTQTENNVIKTAFKILKENLTGNTISLSCLFEHITELTL